MLYCQPVSLTINHDWTNTMSTVKKLLAIKNQNLKVEQFGNAQHYDLGMLGTISGHNLSNDWQRVAGPVINKTMPWLTELLLCMQELKPDDGCISYLNNCAGKHIDLPDQQSALNYIFKNTDSSATTWIGDGKNIETYPSIVETAWILNTQVPHGINNTGERWALSIHFNTDYDQLCKWFDHNTELVFGK